MKRLSALLILVLPAVVLVGCATSAQIKALDAKVDTLVTAAQVQRAASDAATKAWWLEGDLKTGKISATLYDDLVKKEMLRAAGTAVAADRQEVKP